MREILFKAKRIDNGEWVEGNLVLTPNSDEDFKTIIIPFNDNGEYTEGAGDECLGFETWYKVDMTTICQCTGLTDKNGNKIWENDVCNCIYDGRLSIRVIIWDKDELDFKGTNGKKNYGKEFDYLGCCEEIEVIGNIFDNPELLEGSE